jgi:hypothetical protein
VDVQRYQAREWAELVLLWQSLNHHLAHVMETTETNALTKPRARHNLDRLAWQPVRATEPTTLEYFMRDYVGHLKHHLREALPV